MALTGTRPHLTLDGPPADVAEGATALSLSRLFFVEGFVLLLLSRCSLSLSVCPSFFGASGFGFYFWVRGARIGLTTEIGLLEVLGRTHN